MALQPVPATATTAYWMIKKVVLSQFNFSCNSPRRIFLDSSCLSLFNPHAHSCSVAQRNWQHMIKFRRNVLGPRQNFGTFWYLKAWEMPRRSTLVKQKCRRRFDHWFCKLMWRRYTLMIDNYGQWKTAWLPISVCDTFLVGRYFRHRHFWNWTSWENVHICLHETADCNVGGTGLPVNSCWGNGDRDPRCDSLAWIISRNSPISLKLEAPRGGMWTTIPQLFWSKCRQRIQCSHNVSFPPASHRIALKRFLPKRHRLCLFISDIL